MKKNLISILKIPVHKFIPCRKGSDNVVNEGHVVLEMNLGKTKVQFCDDYCRSPEESERIIERILGYALRAYTASIHQKKTAAAATVKE